jgi:hypothetical protein
MENLPYALFRELLAFRFQIQDSDSPQGVQSKIESGLGEFSYPDLQKRALYIGHLLTRQLRSKMHAPLISRNLSDFPVNISRVLMLEDTTGQMIAPDLWETAA